MINGVTIVVDNSYGLSKSTTGSFCMYVSPLGNTGLMLGSSQIIYITPRLMPDVCSYVEYMLTQRLENIKFLETMLLHALTVKG